MAKLVGIAGSLRRHSYNAGLLRAAQTLVPAGTILEIATISGIPLYDADLERAEGVPASVTALKDAIAGADGLLLATPEYNNSLPGVFKNAIDWASRPPADSARIFRGRKVALIGASPSGFGTTLAQAAWLPVFRTLGLELWTGARLLVAGASKAFDEDGTLVDEAVRDKLQKLIAAYVDWIEKT
jgi:chromate reductase, NAD(P)H dehydrogenase (quinone)